MKLDVYLNYAGNCRQAFRFYEQQFGGRITMMMTHGQGPNAANLPTEQADGQDLLCQPVCHAAGPVRHVLDAAARGHDGGP